MITAQITGIGNSVGIILNKEVLARLKVDKGDKVYLSETKDGYSLSVYDQNLAVQMEAAERVMREDKDMLKALANK